MLSAKELRITEKPLRIKLLILILDINNCPGNQIIIEMSCHNISNISIYYHRTNIRSQKTRQNASKKTFLPSLDAPPLLSIKIMGTSVNLKPFL